MDVSSNTYYWSPSVDHEVDKYTDGPCLFRPSLWTSASIWKQMFSSCETLSFLYCSRVEGSTWVSLSTGVGLLHFHVSSLWVSYFNITRNVNIWIFRHLIFPFFLFLKKMTQQNFSFAYDRVRTAIVTVQITVINMLKYHSKFILWPLCFSFSHKYWNLAVSIFFRIDIS